MCKNDLENIQWKNLNLLHEEKANSDIYYYYKIKRENNKMKSLLLRIPTNGKAKGSVTVENILNLPDFNEKDKNTDI